MVNRTYNTNIMNNKIIITSRLELVPLTRELCEYELTSRVLLQQELDARLPDTWPPDMMDKETIQDFITRLSDKTNCRLYAFYWIKLPDTDSKERVLIGSGGFFLHPDGTFELGYSVLEEFQNQGYATEAVASLLEWAFSHHQVSVITATTYPDLKASIRVLEKNLFEYAGSGREKGTIAFQRVCLPDENLADIQYSRKNRDQPL